MHGRQYLNALAVIVNYQPPLADKPLAGGIWGWQLSAAKLAGHYEPKPTDEATLKESPGQQPCTAYFIDSRVYP